MNRRHTVFLSCHCEDRSDEAIQPVRSTTSGRYAAPGYYCPGGNIIEGRGERCLTIGGRQLDTAVSAAFLAALAPAALAAASKAAEQIEAEHAAALAHVQHDVERARYEAQRAERRYRAVEPENRLVARGLEAEWEKCLATLKAAETELERRQHARPRALTPQEQARIDALGCDLNLAWSMPTTTDRDRKELLHLLFEEIIITIDRAKYNAHLTLRWRGGLLSELDAVHVRCGRRKGFRIKVPARLPDLFNP